MHSGNKKTKKVFSRNILVNNHPQVSVMKRFVQTMALNMCVAGMVLAGLSEPAFAQVCSSGTGEPPFLSYGVKSNLLMLLDNSGSMLDLAYQDKGGSLCFDETYMADETSTAVPAPIDPKRVYVGNFAEKTWYVWTPGTAVGTVSTWSSGTCYLDGDLVMDNSVLYKAYCASTNCVSGASNGCLAAGSNLTEDNVNGGLVWGPYFEYDPWRLGHFYAAGDFVKYQNQLYVATSPGVSGGTNPLNDPVCKWVPTEHTWMQNTSYTAGDIVTYKGMIFQARNNFTSNNPATGTDGTIFDDRVGGVTAGALQWDRIDEGYFAEYAGVGTPCPTPSYTHSYTDGLITVTDMAITMVDSSGAKITDVTTQTPADVTCFAATGNFLNWASASKFDIQKGILTGGKFYAGYEEKKIDPADGTTWIIDNSASPQTDTDDDRLVSENRGCAGKGFTKQVTVNPFDSTASNNNIKLTLRTRGSTEKDWIDTTDAATRIEILAVTQNGFNNADCQAVVDAIEAGSGFNSISNLINQCLAGGDNVERAALNHGLQYCEAYRSNKARDLNTIVGDCQTLYTSPTSPVAPSTILPENGSYMCSGVFDNSLPHFDREGYMGRCWGVASSPTCVQVPCPNGNPLPNYYDIAGVWYQCAPDGKVYTCSGNFNAQQSTCNKSWLPEYWDPITHVPCVPAAGGNAGWSDDIDGIPTNPATPEPPDGPLSGTSTNAACHDGTLAEGVDCACIGQAMDDYCQSLAVPEVIDPSDQASSTIDFLSLPGNLIDAGVTSLLGENPLATMKAYSKYTLPADQHSDLPERPDGPRAILYDNASALRIGVMAFMDNGSKAECDKLELLCAKTIDGIEFDKCLADPNSADCEYCRLRQPINKFCPETNSDGANVKSEIDIGVYTDNNGLEVWDHYSAVVKEINDTRATSWTPLAEAMYNALGYYGQKPERCLGSPDGGATCPDFPFAVDPIQYYCQENHILIITEGASTADINQKVADFAVANGDGDTEIGICATGLEGSTYLDDLTYFAHNASAAEIYQVPQLPLPPDTSIPHDKSNITTHIVTTGSLETGTDECSPETIMTAAATNGGSPMGLLRGENPAALKTSLESLFSDLRNRASAGSAASVISSARGGEGAIYQAIFWPELVRPDAGGVDSKVAWAGDVHGLFLDSRGFMFEDTNGDRALRPLEDTTPPLEKADKDKRVIIFFNGTISQACRGTTSIGAVTNDPATCTQQALHMDDAPDGSPRYICCNETAVEMEDVKYLWSANDWLSKISPLDPTGSPVNDDIISNRNPYLTNEQKRYIFTWNDLNNDGAVTSDEILDFTANPAGPTSNWDSLTVAGRGIVPEDFGLPNGVSVERLVNWIRGRDDRKNEDINPANESLDAGEDVLFPNGLLDLPLRSRVITRKSGTTEPITWRLGDIIHSTPMTVAAPAEGYHLIYNDYSYAQFLRKYKGRRHVVYFGANDGMLHAVNAGFYSEKEARFCLYPLDSTGNCTEPSLLPGDPVPTSYNNAPALGAELWAYIPYNLLPHLKCLSDEEYVHKYYVDQRPRIFDVQIFADDAIHPNGWGTILVGGMRFGGAPVDADTLDGDDTNNNDDRLLTSNWFILDITNPDDKPVLLGELTTKNDNTTVNLGYTTGMPTMAIMKEGTCSDGVSTSISSCVSGGSTWTPKTDWYLVFGSGPIDMGGTNALKGISDSDAKVSVLPLNWLVTGKPLRIDPLPPGTDVGESGDDYSGTFTLPSPGGFVSDMITVDYDINPSYEQYKSDVIYFGTVEGNFGTYPDGKSFWNGGGKLYRLINKELIDPPAAFAAPGRKYSTYGRYTTENTTKPADWAIKPLIDLTYSPPVVDTHNYSPPASTSTRYPQPITAAPSVGTDGHNFWIYFGTGRFLDPDDKTDHQQQTYYGIKEPAIIIQDSVTGKQTRYFKWYETAINPTGSNFTGELGLTRVDDILVGESPSIKTAPLTCRSTPSGDYSCLPSQIADAGHAFLYNLDQYISGLGLTSGGLQKRDENGTILNDGGVAECWKHNGCTDGWYKDFAPPYENRERNVGQATLLGGLVTFTTYQPYSDVCKAEGEAWLYGVYYRTGTPWHKNIFGTGGVINNQTQDKVYLGRGLAQTPNLHVGGGPNGGAKAFVQTSTGEIREIEQDNLPINNYQTGRSKWRQCN